VFSPDGKLLASAGKDHTIKIWDPITGTLLKTLTEFSTPVQTLSFSPDGRMLAAVALGFYPDGKHLVFVNDKRAITVWDVSSNREAFSFGEGELERWGVM